MKFRTFMMIAVTLLDTAVCVKMMRGQANTPDYSSLRSEFRLGFAGDTAALSDAMKKAEEALAKDPKAAEPLVLHGAGLAYESRQSFEAGDYDKGKQIFARGIKEMNDSVELQPQNPAVLITRGATFLAATLHMPQTDESTSMLKQGLDDYLKAIDVEKPRWDDLSPALRGRLLFGVADAYYRLNDDQHASEYFHRTATEAKGTGWARQADQWFQTKSLSREQEMCTGCDAH
jgi:tetratricopeptide (TPR) repeat protein